MMSWRRFFQRAKRDTELQREIESYIQIATDESIARGVAPEEARAAAQRKFGNSTLVREEIYRMNTLTFLDSVAHDLRYSLRGMRRNPGFTAIAVLSLALGIGANTAIYSFMESILLRPLPVPDPESLVIMKYRGWFPGPVGFSLSTRGTYRDPDGTVVGSVFPYSALGMFQSNKGVLSSAFGYFRTDQLNVTISEETSTVDAQYVTADYFPGMGIGAAAGRLIGHADGAAAPIAVLGYAFSRRRFGDPASAVGQSIRINDRPFTVVGVVPPEFFGAEPGSVPDVYVPVETIRLLGPQIAGMFLGPNFNWIEIMGRLSSGVTAKQAEAALRPQFERLVRESQPGQPDTDLPVLMLMAGGSGLDSLRREYSQSVYVLMAMCGVILFIACANIANLLLARSAARRREIAVRLSVGAGRLRVIRQLLTESMLLSLAGGALGLFVAAWDMRVLTLLMANGRENFTLHAELNGHVLGVTLLLSIFTGLLFGLASAVQSTRIDIMPTLKATSSAVRERPLGGRRFGVGSVLVTAQIALALVLLTGAGLLGRTLANLYAIDVGFDRDNILLFRLSTRAAGYEGPALLRVFEELRSRLAEIPGVKSASLSTGAVPGNGTMAPIATISGAAIPEPVDDEPPNVAGLLPVGPSFFATMRIPLLAGREFDDRDQPDAPPVVIVNRQLARTFGMENPVGRRLETRMGNNATYEIVGMVGDALWLGLKQELVPVVYLPYTQNRVPIQMTYEVRTSGNPLAYAGSVRQVVRQFDSRLAVSDVTTQSAYLDRAINQEIALSRLAIAFAALALATACIGLYTTVAFQVAQRTNEIGIRVALGATRWNIIRLTAWRVVVLSAVGIAMGVPIALASARLVQSFLFGIEPGDLPTMLLAVTSLILVTLLAAYFPTHRASVMDPTKALRHE
jgi:macrolide transport system ATP-binding/permease protein